MKPRFIKCNLEEIRVQEKGYGSEFILIDNDTKERYCIKVDENLERVKSRLTGQFEGTDEREGIYLSRCMTNININTKGDIWDINEEDWNFYRFNREDVLNLIS